MDVLGGHVSPHTASSSMVAILVMLMSRRKERDGIEIERERERERGQKESGGTSPKVSDYLLVGTWSLVPVSLWWESVCLRNRKIAMCPQ